MVNKNTAEIKPPSTKKLNIIKTEKNERIWWKFHRTGLHSAPCERNPNPQTTQ
jgi:hypothetical protein